MAFDGGLGFGALEPEVEQRVEDAGSDAVVGGELFGLVRGALGDDRAGMRRRCRCRGAGRRDGWRVGILDAAIAG